MTSRARMWVVAGLVAGPIGVAGCNGSDGTPAAEPPTITITASEAGGLDPSIPPRYDIIDRQLREAADVQLGQVNLAIEQGDFAGAIDHIRRVRTDYFNFDAAVRALSLPGSVDAHTHTLLDADKTLIALLDTDAEETSLDAVKADGDKTKTSMKQDDDADAQLRKVLGLPDQPEWKQGAELYTDDFSDPTRYGWHDGSPLPGLNVASDGGAYAWTVTAEFAQRAEFSTPDAAPDHNTAHVSVEADAVQTGGADVMYGLVCPARNDGTTVYRGLISSNGRIEISLAGKGVPQALQSEKDPSLVSSDGHNHLRLDCDATDGGTDVRLFVNGKLVAHAGASATTGGAEGVAVDGAGQRADATVTFDNFSVHALESV